MKMGKIWMEVCLISGRGLKRSSPLWKLQWYAVGWIHPNDKYCTRIDTSGTPNPLWNTKFSTTMDLSESDSDPDLALHVEVYSREPIFLGERLFGSATIRLKEFLDKYHSHSVAPKPFQELGSFQLRKGNSNKHLGFVDVSIRISQERKDEPCSSSLGVDEGFSLDDHDGASKNQESSYQIPIPTSNYYPSNLFPNNPRAPAPSSYLSMPFAVRGGVGNGFGMGVGAGALAGGALIFGDGFISGFDVAGADARDATVSLATHHPPF